MKKKGQANIAGVIGLAVFIFMIIIGVAFIEVLTPELSTARDPSHLDCTNSSISVGTRLTCLTVDLTLPFYVWVMFSVAAAAISGFAAKRKLPQ